MPEHGWLVEGGFGKVPPLTLAAPKAEAYWFPHNLIPGNLRVSAKTRTSMLTLYSQTSERQYQFTIRG